MKRFSITTWLVLGLGVIMILVLQVVAADIIYTNFGTRESYSAWKNSQFAQHYFHPLLAVAFVCCSVAALFSTKPPRQKVAFCLLGALVAAAVYAISSAFILLLYGA